MDSEMAQDTTVPRLNFEYWLNKATEWGQATTQESQKDACLHLPQLQEFLHQIYETLKHMDPFAAIQQFPLIGQLLGRLCWNPYVVGYDESQKTLMWCLCCLYSSEPQNPVESKANSWIRSLLCHLLSSSKWESNEAETSKFISTLGYTSADYYCHLVKNMISSLVTELRGNQFTGLTIQGRVSASHVNAVSLFCVPLITLPDLTPLLETLLLYHGGTSKEILSSEFLEAVNEAFLKKKISLPESAVFSLWLRHLPSLEKATLYLLDQLLSIQMNSLEEAAGVIKDSLLCSYLPGLHILMPEKNGTLLCSLRLSLLASASKISCFPNKIFTEWKDQCSSFERWFREDILWTRSGMNGGRKKGAVGRWILLISRH